MDNNIIVPNGFILNLYKYLNTSPDDFHNMNAFYEDNSTIFEKTFGKREITYGNYDRMQLRPVMDFSAYCNQANQNTWLGTSQSIMLFPATLSTDPTDRVFLIDKSAKSSLRVAQKGGTCNRMKGFMAASFCYISDEARGMIPSYTELLKLCKNYIQNLLNGFNQFLEKYPTNNHTAIIGEVFGTFSSAEIVVLWSAEQYTDILYLTDCIRDIRLSDVPLFRTTYTMISYPDQLSKSSPPYTYTTYDESQVKGDAYVQLALQESVSIEEIKNIEEFIQNALTNVARKIAPKAPESGEPLFQMYNCAGEYDLIFHTKSKYITRLFHNWKHYGVPNDPECLNIHNVTFNKYILHSTTRLCYSKDDLPKFIQNSEWIARKNELSKIPKSTDHLSTLDPNWRYDLISKMWSDTRHSFCELQQDVRSIFPAVSNFSMVLDQLFSDYVQCCSTAADYLWIKDYHTLFAKVITVLDHYLDSSKYDTTNGVVDTDLEFQNELASRLKEMILLVESVQKQINHISASSKLFFKEQNTHFGYTAQYDLIIHAYYGMIKELIKIIYRNAQPNMQSDLYPLINFEPDPGIKSEMFVEEVSPQRSCDGRIIVFHLPLDGMKNIFHYMPMLIHEVYHYAAPIGRGGRNAILAKICVYQLLMATWENIFYEQVNAHVDSYTFSEYEQVKDSIVTTFKDCISTPLLELIQQKETVLLHDLERYYQVNDNDTVLRSWFKICLKNWIFQPKALTEQEQDQSNYLSFGEFLVDVVQCICNCLKTEHGKCDIFEKVTQEVIAQLRTATSDAEHEIYSKILELADTIYENEIESILDQLDEIFPDYAMVHLCNTGISGYLLQIAIDHDANLRPPQSLPKVVYLRYGMMISWLLQQNANVPWETKWEDELTTFKKLYSATYHMHCTEDGEDKKVESDYDVTPQCNLWYCYFKSLYEAYQNNFSPIEFWLLELIDQHMYPAFSSEEDEKKSNCFERFFTKYISILQEPIESQKTKLFNASITAILQFQRRDTIIDLENEKRTEPITARSHSITTPHDKSCLIQSYKYTQTIQQDLDEFHYDVQWILNKMYGYRQQDGISSFTGMWYRGVKCTDYAILPSGFVHFAENSTRIFGSCKPNESNYVQCQRHLYEVFRYASHGSAEQLNPALYTPIDHLALMQHYKQHTNLLDWSEDVYAALYFALESEIIANGSYRKGTADNFQYEAPDKDAVVYILDPIRFNLACEELEKIYHYDNRVKTTRKNRCLIPNLSILENTEPFEEYLNVYSAPYCNQWYESTQRGKVKQEKPTWKNFELPWLDAGLPRAIYTSKLNPRIKAQSGLFVAFSLYSRPAYWKNEALDCDNPNEVPFFYESLENLQDMYLNLTGKAPFLFKIIIPKGLKKPLGETLNRLGLSKEKYYPELDNNRNR